MLINGEAAMLISGNWEISEFAEAGVDDQIGFFATPNTDDDQPVLGLAPDGCYMITAQSENVEEAKKFIEFLVAVAFPLAYFSLISRKEASADSVAVRLLLNLLSAATAL